MKLVTTKFKSGGLHEKHVVLFSYVNAGIVPWIGSLPHAPTHLQINCLLLSNNMVQYIWNYWRPH